jgi:uncharacterized protein YdcH (DUF465 family)
MTSFGTEKFHQLMKQDPEFRALANSHDRYEKRLSELMELTYPTDQEQLEETILKKKKLAAKDRMFAIMLESEKAHGHSH